MSKKPLVSLTFSPMLIVFLVFLVLQLTDVINWSWWWVTAPLWGPIALGIGVMVLFIPIWFIMMVFIEILDELL